MNTILNQKRLVTHDNSFRYVSVPQDLYNSEINFSISTFWDAGFDVRIGLNDGIYENFRTFRECVRWLAEMACEHYPDSEFADEYKD